MVEDRDVRKAKMLKRVDESRAVRAILIVLRQRLETSPTLQKTISSPEFKEQDYAAERKILMAMNNIGLGEGVAAGIATLVLLRRGPQFINRIMTRRGGGASRGGYQLDRPPSASPFQQTNKQPPRGVAAAILGGMKLAIDVGVSFLMGATTSFYFIDDKKLTQQVSSLPLVEGKTVICAEFCTTLQQEVAKRDPDFWKQTTNPYLKNMHQFATNCRKRQSYEAKLREEQGLSPDALVSIPLGGVPADYQSDEDFKESNESESFRDIEGESFFGEDSMDQWGDSMVTDREDDRK